MNDIEELMQAVPNLDCFIDAVDVRKIAKFCATLADYANEKANAMDSRLAGDVITAIKHERNCDCIYVTNLKGKVDW